MADDRIAKLSQRFKQHAVGRQPAAKRDRVHRSFYLDGDVIERVDKSYREVNHQLHPNNISKSVFLETALEYALDHLDDLKASLEGQPGSDSSTETR